MISQVLNRKFVFEQLEQVKAHLEKYAMTKREKDRRKVEDLPEGVLSLIQKTIEMNTRAYEVGLAQPLGLGTGFYGVGTPGSEDIFSIATIPVIIFVVLAGYNLSIEFFSHKILPESYSIIIADSAVISINSLLALRCFGTIVKLIIGIKIKKIRNLIKIDVYRARDLFILIYNYPENFYFLF